MATFSAHTASRPPPSRTPAGSRASSRRASITRLRSLHDDRDQCDVDRIPKGSHSGLSGYGEHGQQYSESPTGVGRGITAQFDEGSGSTFIP
jgi:hypothetical protein